MTGEKSPEIWVDVKMERENKMGIASSLQLGIQSTYFFQYRFKSFENNGFFFFFFEEEKLFIKLVNELTETFSFKLWCQFK